MADAVAESATQTPGPRGTRSARDRTDRFSIVTPACAGGRFLWARLSGRASMAGRFLRLVRENQLQAFQ
jgi:hypothetical protein